MPKVQISIVMTVFNDSMYIKEAIESVLLQSFKDWELIIVDDASTDSTPKVIKKYTKIDYRIKYYRLRFNKGAPASINVGIKKSNGEFIARIDSDDIWIDKNKLKKQLIIMKKNPKCGLIGTWAKVIDKNGKDLFNLIYPIEDLDIRNQMLKHNCFVSSSVLIRKKLFDAVGVYDTISKYAEDYGLWLRLGTVGQLHNIPKNMTGYRINPNGISQTKGIEQIKVSLCLIKESHRFYPNYYQGLILWNLRKYYPSWFRGKVSIKIKRNLLNLANSK